MGEVIQMVPECPCCALREEILDCMAESGLSLEEILFVLDGSKEDAVYLCSPDDEGDAA